MALLRRVKSARLSARSRCSRFRARHGLDIPTPSSSSSGVSIDAIATDQSCRSTQRHGKSDPPARHQYNFAKPVRAEPGSEIKALTPLFTGNRATTMASSLLLSRHEPLSLNGLIES
jgi:hypothetical protein